MINNFTWKFELKFFFRLGFFSSILFPLLFHIIYSSFPNLNSENSNFHFSIYKMHKCTENTYAFVCITR